MTLVSTPLARQVIGCAIKVHRALGPGLFESAYQQCLVYELIRQGVSIETQVPLRLVYDGLRLPCVYRADLIVEGQLLVELKSIEQIHPVHHSQMLTYLRLAGIPQGLLINFNTRRLVDGLKSFLMGQPGSWAGGETGGQVGGTGGTAGL